MNKVVVSEDWDKQAETSLDKHRRAMEFFLSLPGDTPVVRICVPSVVVEINRTEIVEQSQNGSKTVRVVDRIKKLFEKNGKK